MSTVVTAPYSTIETARLVNRTPARIRQLCAEHKIGKKYGRDWFLSDEDLERLRALLRPEKNSD